MPDLPEKPRGSQPYLPPPPDTRDGSPQSLHFPRMQPPPASLEAMMRGGSALGSARRSVWLWVLALVASVACAAYLLGSHR